MAIDADNRLGRPGALEISTAMFEGSSFLVEELDEISSLRYSNSTDQTVCSLRSLFSVYRFAQAFLRGCVHMCFATSAWNSERAPNTGPLILVSNHNSFLDSLLLGCAVHREIHFMARNTLAIRRLFRSLKAIDVDREGSGAGAARAAMQRLASGSAICIFPQGTRVAEGVFDSAEDGVGWLAIKSHAPVLPVRVFGTAAAWGRGKLPRLGSSIAVKFGRKVRFNMLAGEKLSAEGRKEIRRQVTEEIMRRISNLEAGAD